MNMIDEIVRYENGEMDEEQEVELRLLSGQASVPPLSALTVAMLMFTLVVVQSGLLTF